MHAERRFSMISIETLKNRFENKRVSVIGIGISNRPLIELLVQSGAIVTARDKKSRESLGEIAQSFEEKGVRLIAGDAYLDGIDDEIIFRTPGMRYDHPALAEAVANGATLTSEMQLFFDLCPAKIIGITGSDGKTTTTTLISEMLKAEGKRVFLGGNIGKPLLPDLFDMTPSDYCVIELSSFQLHTMTKSPHVAVITNLSPNHLDYHTDEIEYIEAKFNVFLHQNEGDRLVVNGKSKTALDTILTERVTSSRAPHSYTVFNAWEKADGDTVCEENGMIFCGSTPVLAVRDIKIPGKHNVENYMAAIAALWGSVSIDTIQTIAKSFGGVEHRIEYVRTVNGANYYNSSIDSSPSRTIAALNAFGDKKLIVLLGGKDKKTPYTPLGEPLCQHAKIIILTGQTATQIRDSVLSSPTYSHNNPEIILANDYAEAVKIAHRVAQKDDVVLLSPASTSFDAFANFEERGRFFKAEVHKL